MIKTLSVTIKDIDLDGDLTIKGTRNTQKFNPVVILTTGFGSIALDSQKLATALAEVVNFQAEGVDPIVPTAQIELPLEGFPHDQYMAVEHKL